MSTNVNPVVHFEMPYENQDRMVKFYRDVFGWDIQVLGPEMGNYAVVSVLNVPDVKPDVPRGTIGGGFFGKDPQNTAPSLVIGVPDIREAMRKIEAAGGTVLGGDSDNTGEPHDIPGTDIGRHMNRMRAAGHYLTLSLHVPVACCFRTQNKAGARHSGNRSRQSSAPPDGRVLSQSTWPPARTHHPLAQRGMWSRLRLRTASRNPCANAWAYLF